MASGLSDDVDCARLAKDAVELERDYPLKDLSRLQDLLAESRGSMRARFAFSRLASGRPGASVAVSATPRLICQRCLQGFDFPVAADSAIEFASSEAEAPTDSLREIYVMRDGSVNLREVAEEELLLAIPVAAACTTPESCGRAPAFATARIVTGTTTRTETTGTLTTGGASRGTEATTDEPSRPFAGLKDLLKKT